MKGYRRGDGRVGIRNVVAIMYTVECAHHVAERIAREISGAEVFGFAGCYSDPYAFRMLVELGKHPNVAGVLLVRLGCESTNVDKLKNQIAASSKRVELITIQETGGTLASIERGKQLALEMVAQAEQVDCVEISWSNLIK